MAETSNHALASAAEKPPQSPPCVLVLFGVTGDLAGRKIVPALYNLARDGLLHERTGLLGVARRDLSDEDMRGRLREALERHSRTRPIDDEVWETLTRNWHYAVAHAGNPDEFEALAGRVRELDEAVGAGGNRLHYIATKPDTFGRIINHIGKAGLHQPGADGAFCRLVVEKPIGWDLSSARQLNECIEEWFDELDVCRIDHYLGKETVQNLLVFRFGNAVFEPLLNCRFVDRVEITTAEPTGMEGRRGPYYERAGALRDMVQNHMLQLLALVAMERPDCIRCEEVRDRKVELLQAVRPPPADRMAEWTARGQYLSGEGVPAYREEEGVAEDSRTETYAAVRLSVDNDRWRDVPFYLRTGKRLAQKASQIVIVFRRQNAGPFADPACDVREGNRLTIRLYPDEGISLSFDAKVPGVRRLLRPVRMDFRYGASFESASPEAYEHLLLDALRGESMSFIRRDEVEASWRVIDPIETEWERSALPKLQMYPPGSWGPEVAPRLFGDPYADWQSPRSPRRSERHTR